MNNTLLKTTSILMVLTFIAKVIAFLREMLIAYFYGAAASTDAYFLSEGLMSNILYALNTAISVAFLPLYIKRKKKQGSERFLAETLGMAILFAGLVFLIINVCSKPIAAILAPQELMKQQGEISLYLKILSTGMFFSLMTNIFLNLLNAERVYGYAAFTGIIYSITIILFSLFFRNRLGILALVGAIPVAYLLQSIFLYLRSLKVLKVKVLFHLRSPDIKNLIKNSMPILFSNTVVELNQIIDRFLAGQFGDGAISALSYSKTLCSFVNSLFFTTIITVLFTEITYIVNDKLKFQKEIQKGIACLFMITVPIVCSVIFLNFDIVKIVYGRGAFKYESIKTTSQALLYYNISFSFTIIHAFLVKAFYALEDTMIPMKNGIICMSINIVLSILLSRVIGFNGIAIGTSISTVLAVFLLYRKLKIKLEIKPDKSFIKIYAKCLLGGVVSSMFFIFINQFLSFNNSLWKFLFCSLIIFVTYILSLIILKCEGILIILKRGKNEKV